MKEEWLNAPVLYVDAMLIVHRGAIVGASKDGQTVYIRCSSTDGHDMEVNARFIPAMLQLAKDYPA